MDQPIRASTRAVMANSLVEAACRIDEAISALLVARQEVVSVNQTLHGIVPERASLRIVRTGREAA